MNEEQKAVEVLSAAGLVDDDQEFYELDKIFSGRPEPVKFTEPGDFVTGLVVEAFTRQKTVFGTGDPVWNDDGSPKLEAALVINTADGLRTLYVSSWRMEKALGEAFSLAGVRGPRRGGELFVKFTTFGDPYKPGAPPPKEYEAAYDSPAVVAGRPSAERLETIRQASQVRQALPPAQPGQLVLSGECAALECRACSDRKCTHKCHSATRAPEPVTESAPAEIPF